jgi:hypothetical protein
VQSFGPTASQEEVFNTVVRPMVTDVANGLHAAVLCYGANNTGKSYTMEGVVDDFELKGASLCSTSCRAVFTSSRQVSSNAR